MPHNKLRCKAEDGAIRLTIGTESVEIAVRDGKTDDLAALLASLALRGKQAIDWKTDQQRREMAAFTKAVRADLAHYDALHGQIFKVPEKEPHGV